jgi:hypothetical protein
MLNLAVNEFGKLVRLVGFIIKKFVTMHGHMNVKSLNETHCRLHGAMDLQEINGHLLSLKLINLFSFYFRYIKKTNVVKKRERYIVET